MICNRIKELRERKGVSQQELAETLSVARSNISKYEQGKLDLSTEMMIAFSEYFNVSIDYLLCITDIPTHSIKTPIGYYDIIMDSQSKGLTPEKLKKILELFESM